jgi:dTDP-4-dehydrorhamnose 3,5-epimerase
MKVTRFDIEGLLLLEPRVFEDERGYFLESFNELRYNEFLGGNYRFVQDNISRSAKNVLRGLHFQYPPHAQGKIVSVVKGRVLDVAVDIRKDSPTYGKSQIVELSEDKHDQFWIPPGFAHGFIALEDETVFSYKCSAYYHPASECTLLWNDPELAIEWQIKDPIISSKDKEGLSFHSFNSPF